MSDPVFDHVMYAAPDLVAAVDALEQQLGVRAACGGEHAGLGTHNALLGLGGRRYLEIIGPIPGQADASPWASLLAALPRPQNLAWAVRADVERFATGAKAVGYDAGSIMSMSRATPDGPALTWRLTMGGSDVIGGILPFAIQWDCAEHPADSAPSGCTLADFRAQHPEPERARTVLQALGIDLPVEAGSAPTLILTLDTPNGIVKLR